MIRQTLLANALCLIVALGGLAQDDVHPDLTGTVVDASGNAVAGATVFIYTASVKNGYSTYCPSCYADCTKSATTHADGKFTIASLDPELFFNLLTVADGYKPVLTKKIDPFNGPVRLEIEQRRAAAEDPRTAVHGTVVDAEGQPVVGAVIHPDMVYFVGGGGRGGAVEGLDQLSVTNAKGQFEIRYTEALTCMDLAVSARGLATRFFAKCATGDEDHVFSLNGGATVSGRLLQDGKPVGGVQMGLVQADRSPLDGWFGPMYIGTREDGSFTFDNVPVGYEWYVYGTMDSLRDRGAVEATPVKTSEIGQFVKVGKVRVIGGHHLKGQVILTDGKDIEPGMRIFISRGLAWDTQIVELPADGRFEFVELPTERYDISASIRGYHLASANPNLNGISIEGTIDRDFDDFVILMDPGRQSSTPAMANLRDRPLQSAARMKSADGDSN